MNIATEKKLIRLFEYIPGTLTWSILLIPIVFSFIFPELVAIFVIIYTLLWFFRSVKFSYYLIYSFYQAKLYNNYDWLRILQYFDTDDTILKNDILACKGQKNKLYLLKHIEKQKKALMKNGEFKSYKNLKHAVIVATYKESIEILQSSIGSLRDAQYDLKNVYVVLATEERDSENAHRNAKQLEKEFGNTFGAFFHVMHPKDLPGEIPGKGGNITFAGKFLAEEMKKRNIDFSDVIVTTLDADNRVHANYFANLSCYYLMTSNRKKRSYQPLPLFYNNIWNVPALNRITAISSSFWHVIESGRPDRLRNFSSHAQSLDALNEMDFWSTQTIVEDGHQFWRAYFHFKGDHKVVPTFIPIYQDAVENNTYFSSIVCQYKQLRRWAWGCTDIAFVLINMIKSRNEIPLYKIKPLYRLIEGHLMWATAPIVIAMAPFVPSMLNSSFQNTVLAYNVPTTLSYLYTCALGGIMLSMLISLFTLPKPPNDWKIRISAILQWGLFPITTILLASLPAIESQTRLMLNKRLDFNVTAKIRKSAPPKKVSLQEESILGSHFST